MIDLYYLSNVAYIHLLAVYVRKLLFTFDKPAVYARNAHSVSAFITDKRNDFLVSLSDQNHLRYPHRLLVGDPKPVYELALDAKFI